jgi:hypothetical protein
MVCATSNGGKPTSGIGGLGCLRFAMRFETYRWLLIPVMVIHNLEEWATFPAYASISPTLATHGAVSLAQPPWRVLEVAWIIVTVLPSALVIAAARARHSRLLDTLVCWVASIYLANAFMPHAIDLLIGRTYAPGVATALLLNLPFCSLMLRQAAREHYLTPRQVVTVGAAGFASLVPVLLAVFAMASAITRVLGNLRG